MAENQIICAFIFEKNAYPIKLLKGISISLCGNLQEHIIDVMKRTILFYLLTVKHPGSAENCPSDKKTGAVILDI